MEVPDEQAGDPMSGARIALRQFPGSFFKETGVAYKIVSYRKANTKQEAKAIANIIEGTGCDVFSITPSHGYEVWFKMYHKYVP